nr:APC family permease [uncultured Actinoplanes sp.]
MGTRTLGSSAVAFFALAASAPILTLVTVVPAAFALGGGPLVPITFLALGALLLLFTTGYAAMGRRAPYAGALSTFITRGLGRPAGIAAAWVALGSYQAIQLALYGLAGAAAAPLLDVPWWQVSVACWLLVVVLGPIRAEVTSGLLALVVLAQAAVVAGYAAANVIDPAADGMTAALPVEIDRPVPAMLLVIGALTFIGFETTGAYAEESFRPRRGPGHAAYASILTLTLLGAAGAWSLSIAAGPGQIGALARARGSELVFDLAAARLTPWAVTLGRIMLLAAVVAAALALHHTMVRYLSALGRERVLPSSVGGVAASLTQSAVAGLLLTIVVPGYRLTLAGGLGIVVLLTATSVAALLHLNRVPDGEGGWARFVAPILATVGLGVVAYLGVVRFLGVVEIAVVAGAALLGVLHALLLRRVRPVVYAGIGHAGAAVVVTPALPRQRQPGAHRPERLSQRTPGSGPA